MAGLTVADDEIKELKRKFTLLDKNKDGIVSKSEINELLNYCDNIDLENVLKNCNFNSDGNLSFEEFITCTVDV